LPIFVPSLSHPCPRSRQGREVAAIKALTTILLPCLTFFRKIFLTKNVCRV
jgi:hypothetical protein